MITGRIITHEKNILILGLWPLLSAPSFAQGGEKDNRKAIESYRVAYMTQHLQLTPQEAQKFWPVYNQMQAELKVFVRKAKERCKSLKQVVTNKPLLTMNWNTNKENWILLKNTIHH